jgi:gamma-glutamyltranspeptidase/glutathione hydrolase
MMISRRVSAAALTAALFLSPVSNAFAQAVPIPTDQARILPVVAQNGMAVSQEARASQVAVDVLRLGGNAVDAAVALGLTLAVTLPEAGNLGGGGFMLVHLAKEKKTVAIDYRELAPADTPVDVFLDEKGEFVPAKSQDSGLGIGVPGTVAGLALALEKYGSGRFTLADLAAPAAKFAREGLPVVDGLYDAINRSARRLNRFASSRAIFLQPDGQAPARGARLVQKDLADTLEAIGREGPKAFYEGEIARKIVASVQAAGGRMTLDDMKTYRAIERVPVRGTFRNREILSMPPPSSGGVHIIEILNILEGWPLTEYGHNSAQTLHLMAEAMKPAYADRSEYLGDPDFVKVPVVALTSKKYAAALREKISQDRIRPAAEIRPGQLAPYESDQTTHFSVVDKDGNAVSNTYTLNFLFGVGLVADGTGVLLNNELDDFAAKPNAPNAFGLMGGAANAPGPRKRPLSSMSPTMVFRDGELEIVTGSPGGSRIITTVAQMILNIVEHGMNVAEAMEAPRVHHQWTPDELRIERGISIDTIRLLQAKGHRINIGTSMGSTQTIHRSGGVLMGAADTRQRGTGASGY